MPSPPSTNLQGRYLNPPRTMLGQRRRRWTNIGTTLGRCLVFAETLLQMQIQGFGSRSRRFERNKMFLPHPRVKVSIVGSLRDREVACSASDRQGSNFESCVWRTVSSQSSHHPQEVLLAQFSLYVHKGGLKPDSFHFSRCPVVSSNGQDKKYRNSSNSGDCIN